MDASSTRLNRDGGTEESGIGDAAGSIPSHFACRAAAHGERLAVADGDRRVSYAELDARSRGIAGGLLAAGLPAGQPVYLLLDQGLPFISALLGVLRAGRAFVPMDKRNPVRRNRLMLADSTSPAVLTDRAHEAEARSAGAARLLFLDSLPEGDAGDLPRPGADDLACILYTSGSTGRPKGVMHDHRNILHNTRRHLNAFHVGPEDRMSLMYPCSVYGGCRDIFIALLSGASIWTYPLPVLGVAPLAGWLRENSVTVYCSVATVFRQFVGALERETFPALRLMKLGGEAVLAGDVELFRRHFGDHAVLSCGLASTETGAVRQCFVDADTPIDGTRVPCGFPVEGVELLLLNEEGQPVPRGETGEIHVRSPFIALGYWQQPELTRRSFAVDPSDPRIRIYRMGDLGVMRPDGQLEHRGRRDKQVKINGNRVELLEVEAALVQQPGVGEAAVVTRERAGRPQLVAFYVGKDDAPEPATLRHNLSATLPAYMIPTGLHRLRAMPLLPSGKIDRQELTAPGSDAAGSTTDDASTETVELLRGIWRQLLDLPQIDEADSFFELGGDSLAVAQLTLAVEKRWRLRYRLDLVSRAPTLGQMAAYIDADLARGATTPLPAERRTENGYRPELLKLRAGTPGRAPLILLPPAGGNVFSYAELAAQMPAELPIYALRIAPPVEVREAALNIRELAAIVEELVMRRLPEGDCWLAGWSFGGFLGWELAGRLRDRGRTVRPLIVIDSNCSMVLGQSWLRRRIDQLRMMAEIARENRPMLRRISHNHCFLNAQRGGLFGLWSRLRLRLFFDAEETRKLGGMDASYFEESAAVRQSWRTMRHYLHAIRSYPMRAMDHDIELLTTPGGSRRSETLGWERFCRGTLRRHALAVEHAAVFSRDHIVRLVGLLQRIMTQDGTSRRR